RGITLDRVEVAITAALAQIGRRVGDVRELVTIDLKANEPALRDWCRAHQTPLRVIARKTVAARPWAGTASPWVRANLGLEGVCEPCALIATVRGHLLLPKTTLNGVAVAVAEDALPIGHLRDEGAPGEALIPG
ncbi:MAG: cobalamin biosynthesis protein, partial [Verrucomicrobia bacterium]|nr:cobalamin biosynthesis protein [Verrucomicrobiota bacterium]